MALPDTTNKIQYTVSSATTDYDYPYKYWEQSDITVSVVDLTSGVQTDLSPGGGDFSVSPTNGDPAQGATVTTSVGYDNHRVTLERIIPFTSEAAFVRGDGIPPDSLNNGLDKATAQIQQLDDSIARKTSHPSTDPTGLNYEAPTVELRASKASGYDVNGNVVALDLASSGTVSGNSNAGISVTSNIISAKVDDSSIEFDGSGDISVKDAGIVTAMIQDSSITKAKIEDVTAQAVLGNTTASSAPVEVPIVGATGLLLDEDAMGTDSDTKGATQQSIKAYVLSEATKHGIVQQVHTSTGAKQYFTSQTAIPFDDTIPQSGEGSEVMTLAITPTSATNYLKVEVVAVASHVGQNHVCSLFRDSGADAIACSTTQTTSSQITTHSFLYRIVAGSTVATTFKVRVGGDSTTTTFNGDNNDLAKYGGVLASSITITEIGD